MLQELRKLSPEILKLYADDPRVTVSDTDYVPDGPALATWWVQKTPGTTYWRCTVPARHLPGRALHLRHSDLVIGEDGEVYVPRQGGQTAIWQFVGVAVRALIMAHQQEQGLRVLMELDDSYLRPVPIPRTRGERSHWQTSLKRGNAAEYSYQAHRKIIRWVDGLIVSTPFLAEQYVRHTDAPIYVCPNSIDLDDFPGHEEGFSPSDTLTIGYSGSQSHRYDLAIVERALDWAWRQEGVELAAVGQGFSDRLPHKKIPWAGIEQYRRNLRVLDVGLCPLKRSDWHDCKSDIKAMEYLLAGAVPIVQGDSPCYSDWVGIVPSAVTEKDWLRQVKWAVRAPREELREVWQRGYDFLLRNKLIEQHIDKWREACSPS